MLVRMTADPVCLHPVLRRDAEALIGLLAVMEGEAMVSRLDAGLVKHLSRRLAAVGLVADGATDREFRQALEDLNHRLRYALGESDDAPPPAL